MAITVTDHTGINPILITVTNRTEILVGPDNIMERVTDTPGTAEGNMDGAAADTVGMEAVSTDGTVEADTPGTAEVLEGMGTAAVTCRTVGGYKFDLSRAKAI